MGRGSYQFERSGECGHATFVFRFRADVGVTGGEEICSWVDGALRLLLRLWNAFHARIRTLAADSGFFAFRQRVCMGSDSVITRDGCTNVHSRKDGSVVHKIIRTIRFMFYS